MTSIPEPMGFHHVRLTVSDFERSLSFYTEVLGFAVAVRVSETSALLRAGPVVLAINAPWHEISEAEERFDEARVGLDHLAFRAATPEDVARAAAHLDGRGVPNSGVKPGRFPGTSLVVFRDPDNIQLEYYYSP